MITRVLVLLSIGILVGCSFISGTPTSNGLDGKSTATVSSDVDNQTPASLQKAVFAGGCFWGVDAVFKHVKGVVNVRSGYSGGNAETAKYEIVSEGKTGHAESVEVTFDPGQVSYEKLLEVFFSVVHDPTELNYQGPDHGTQYRSAIFFTSDEQKQAALAYIEKLNASKAFKKPIVTEVVPFKAFYEAEDYHQNYLANHPDEPYIVYNDIPKVKALKKNFPQLYKE
jgi:peptide-methionine (S)-S-oxide reductase